MKAIINFFCERDSWFHEFFSFRSPLTIPFAVKPLAHHLLDFCSNLQIEEVLLLDYRFDDSLAEELNTSYQWYPKLKYMGAKTIQNVRKLLPFHRSFCGDDDILILNGFFFIGGAPNQTEEDWKKNVVNIKNSLEPCAPQPTGSGIYYSHNNELFIVRIPQIRQIHSIQDYFNLNLSIIDSDQQCSLPGYDSHDGIIFGSNPVIMSGCSFNEDDNQSSSKHTILIGDNVRIEHDCALKGPAIIGNNVILDTGVHLERSIIFDNTYISNDLELIDKIVNLKTIINPFTNAIFVQDDDSLTGDTRTRIKQFFLGSVRSAFNYVMACILAIHLFICYVFFLCFFFAWTTRSKRWYFKFSLDKVPGVLMCLGRRKDLVGCMFPPDNSGNSAVFTYSEAIQSLPDPTQWHLDDQYFLAHDSIRFRFSIITTILITRIFQHDDHIRFNK